MTMSEQQLHDSMIVYHALYLIEDMAPRNRGYRIKYKDGEWYNVSVTPCEPPDVDDDMTVILDAEP